MAKLGFCFLLGAVVLLAIIQQGTPLKCYQCNSVAGGVCGTYGKVDKKKIGSIKCGSSQKYCGILQKQVNGTRPGQTNTTIIRNCFSSNTCDIFISNGTACTVCSKNLCNSSIAMLPSVIIGFITLCIVGFFAN